jgi:hypothetical protein
MVPQLVQVCTLSFLSQTSLPPQSVQYETILSSSRWYLYILTYLGYGNQHEQVYSILDLSGLKIEYLDKIPENYNFHNYLKYSVGEMDF